MSSTLEASRASILDRRGVERGPTVDIWFSTGWVVFGQALMLIYFLGMTASHLRDPYVMDEIEMPLLAQAISQTGQPIYYKGLSSPTTDGTYHVPFYGYVLAGWLQVFGNSVPAVRSFSVLCALVAWLLELRIVAQLCRALEIPALMPAMFYSTLLLTSAFWIQSAVLPDIDGTTLLVSSLGMITLLLDWLRKSTWGYAVACGFVLGIALLSKLTTPIGLFLLIPLAAWVGRRERDVVGWLQLVTIPVIAVVLFLVGWGSLSKALSLDFWYPFRFTFFNVTHRTSGVTVAGMLNNLLDNKRGFYWFGLGLTACLIGGVGGATKLAISRPTARPFLSIVIAATLLLFCGYTLITGPVFWFCKYYVGALPLAVALAAVVLGGGTFRFTRKELIVLVGAAAAGLFWMIVRERDAPLLPGMPLRFGIRGTVAQLLVLGMLAVSGVVLWRAKLQQRIATAPALMLPFAFVALCQNAGFAWTQAGASYQTRYYYGEGGLSDVVKLLKRELKPDDTLLAPKDVGLLVSPRYYEEAVYFDNQPELTRLLSSKRPRFLVVRRLFDYSSRDFPEVDGLFRQAGYEEWRQIENFTVWRRRTAVSP